MHKELSLIIAAFFIAWILFFIWVYYSPSDECENVIYGTKEYDACIMERY